MKSRLSIASFLLVAFTLALSGQEKPDLNDKKTPAPRVSEDEIRSQRVDFINASNLPASDQQRRESYEAGKKLAEQVIATGQSGNDQVSVQRIFDPAAPGFGADIITISPKANFAHINAIQRIVAGYMQRAYEYSPADSETVSKFVLYYNARFRGKSETLKGKYSDTVMAALKPDTAGIDRMYRNWAGRTQLVIPLVKNVVRPGKTDVNTNEIKKETDNAKKDEKKQLTDIENRRKDETDKKLDQKQDQLKKEEQKIEQKKDEIRRQQDEVKQQKEDTGKKIQELQRDPVKNADEIKKQEQKQQEITRTEQDLKKQEEQVKKEETANKTEQKEVKDQKEQKTEPQKTDTTPAQEDKNKIDTLKKENEDLKKQQEDKEQKSENVVGEKILFLRFMKYHSDGHYSNELWMLDPKKDDTLFKSPYTNICGREFVVVQGQGILVIGYEGTADTSREHLLVLLDAEKLTLKTKSKENIYWRSPLISRDNKIYAFEVKDGQYYLTRFNPDLTVDARSSEAISGDSDVTFYNDKIYVTGKETTGSVTNIKVFNRTDLKHLKTITPPK